MTAKKTALKKTKPIHTPNGYDPLWIEAINNVLNERDSDVRITDIDDGLWERFIGPMIDFIERDEADVTCYDNPTGWQEN